MANRKEKTVQKQPSLRDGNYTFSFVKDWHCLTLLALFLAIFFRQIIFQNAFLWEDFLYYFYPVRNFASVSFANGELPLWNPYTFGGMPFQADIQTTVFYLPNFLLVPFVSAGKLSSWYVEIFTIAHFFVSGVTMYYCAKSFGLSRIPALFSALAYMLSGFAIVHTIHLVVVAQLAWFPLIVFLFKKTIEEHSILSMVLTAFALSLAVLGGHPQFTLYIFFFLLIFFLVEAYHVIKESKGNQHPFPLQTLFQISLLAAGVIIVAIGFSAIQLLPTSELANYSQREEITFAKSSEGEFSWLQLITFIIPKFFGSANQLAAENPVRYWGPGMYWTFWEACFYCGIAVFTLALFSLSSIKVNRYTLFFACYALFAVLYALGDNFIIHGLFYKFVPGFDKFRSMGRWGFFSTFSIAILGGIGLQKLISERGGKLFPKITLAVGGVALLITIAVYSHALDGILTSQILAGAFKGAPISVTFPMVFNTVSSMSLQATGVILVTCFVLFLCWKRITPPTLTIILILVVQFLDVYIFGYNQNNSANDPDAYFAQQKTVIEKLKAEQATNYFRTNSRGRGGMLFDRNQGMIDKVFLMEGYTPLALQHIFPPLHSSDTAYELMNTKYRMKQDTVRVQGQLRSRLGLRVDSSFLPRAFFTYKYNVFTTAQQESLFLYSDQFNPREMVTLNHAPVSSPGDTAYTGNWKANIESYGNNSISLKVSTPKTGFLVLSEIYYPGWNAYVDGKQTEVMCADWSLRALVVEQGEHNVELKFEPKSFYAGMKITFATILLGLGLAGFDWMRKRKKRTEDTGTKQQTEQ